MVFVPFMLQSRLVQFYYIVLNIACLMSLASIMLSPLFTLVLVIKHLCHSDRNPELECLNRDRRMVLSDVRLLPPTNSVSTRGSNAKRIFIEHERKQFLTF